MLPPSIDPTEEVDLDVELRRYVLSVGQRLAELDHYDILEVPRGADPRAIKRAFFRLAAALHPDRFYGKRLGGYKGPLLALFARVTEAYDTLSAPGRRAGYDAALPVPAPDRLPPPTFPTAVRAVPSPPPPPPLPPADDRRRVAMDALKQRFVEGKASARQHVEAAARGRAAGDFEGALAAYRAALRYTPDDAALRASHDEVARAAAERAADARRRQAQLEERYGHWKEAAESWRRVTEVRPDDVEARERLALALQRARSAGG